MLWFVGATAAAVGWLAAERRDLRSPLLHAAVLLTLLGLDDLFLLHEKVYSRVIDAEGLIFGTYALLFVLFTVLHRKVLEEHGVLALVPIALLCFAASTFMDLRYDEKQSVEDGTKLLGIATLALMAGQLAVSSLVGERRATTARRAQGPGHDGHPRAHADEPRSP